MTVEAAADPILRIDHVTKRFGGLVAVDDVTFDVKKGRLDKSDQKIELDGKLTIEIAGMTTDVTLTQTPGPPLTGACVTKGALNLRRVRVTGFGAGGLSATCLPASGCDHEADSGAATTLRVLGSSVDGNHSASKGVPRMGTRHLGVISVRGRRRRPSPAAKRNAFKRLRS